MEAPPTPERTEAERLVAEWLRGPTVLASGSQRRLEALEEFGFADLTPAGALTEELERETIDSLNEAGGTRPSHLDERGQDFTRWVASAKVQAVLEKGDIPADRLVLGFDTAPMYFANPEDPESDRGIDGAPHVPHKPESMDEARAMVERMITTTAAGTLRLRDRLAAFRASLPPEFSEEDKEMIVHNHRFAIDDGQIHVYTGAAASFPHEHPQTIGLSEHTKLFSRAIAEAAENEAALEHLIERVLDQMGERALGISGGVDYSDNSIREVLRLEEVGLHGIERHTPETHYQGFSPTLLRILLRSHAEDKLRSNTA